MRPSNVRTIASMQGDQKITYLSNLLFKRIVFDSSVDDPIKDVIAETQYTIDTVIPLLKKIFHPLDVVVENSIYSVNNVDGSIYTLVTPTELHVVLHILSHRLLQLYEKVEFLTVSEHVSRLVTKYFYINSNLSSDEKDKIITNIVLNYLQMEVLSKVVLKDCHACETVNNEIPISGYLYTRNKLLTCSKEQVCLERSVLVDTFTAFQNIQSNELELLSYKNRLDAKQKLEKDFADKRNNLSAAIKTGFILIFFFILFYKIF